MKNKIILITFLSILSNVSFGQFEGIKYGFIKNTRVNWFDSTLAYQDSIYAIAYRLDNCDRVNIIFNTDGSFIYNNIETGRWYKENDSIVKLTNPPKYNSLNNHNGLSSQMTFNFSGDTLVLHDNFESQYYLPCNNLSESKSLIEKYIKYRYLNWGIVGGINYSKSIFYEFGISRSKLETDFLFYSGDLTFEYNPINKIYGLNLYTYMYSKSNNLNFFRGSMIMGINLNTYTNFDKYNIGVKPLFGLSGSKLGKVFSGLQFIYGYNIIFGKQRIENLNRHFIALRYNLPLYKKKQKVVVTKNHYILYHE